MASAIRELTVEGSDQIPLAKDLRDQFPDMSEHLFFIGTDTHWYMDAKRGRFAGEIDSWCKAHIGDYAIWEFGSDEPGPAPSFWAVEFASASDLLQFQITWSVYHPASQRH